MPDQNSRYIPGYLDTQTGQFVQQIPQETTNDQAPQRADLVNAPGYGVNAQVSQALQRADLVNAPGYGVNAQVSQVSQAPQRADLVNAPGYGVNAQAPRRADLVNAPGYGVNAQASQAPQRADLVNAPGYGVNAQAPVNITQTAKIPVIRDTAKQSVNAQAPQRADLVNAPGYGVNAQAPRRADLVNAPGYGVNAQVSQAPQAPRRADLVNAPGYGVNAQAPQRADLINAPGYGVNAQVSQGPTIYDFPPISPSVNRSEISQDMLVSSFPDGAVSRREENNNWERMFYDAAEQLTHEHLRRISQDTGGFAPGDYDKMFDFTYNNLTSTYIDPIISKLRQNEYGRRPAYYDPRQLNIIRRASGNLLNDVGRKFLKDDSWEYVPPSEFNIAEAIRDVLRRRVPQE